MKKGMKIFIAVICIVVVLGACVGGLFLFEKSVRDKRYVGTVSTETWDRGATYVDESTFVTLYKKPDKDFVILNVTDIHQSDFDYRLYTGVFARREIKRLVDAVHPDLITISGDITCAKSEYYSVHAFTDFMNGLQIPWAPVFGNHDSESENCDKNYLADVMMGGENSYCVMRKGPNNFAEEGDNRQIVGNYVINILEEGTNKLCQTLYMVDTANSHLNQKQISWYRQAVRTVKKLYGNDKILSYNELPSTMIMHIPVAELSYAYMMGFDFDKNEWKKDWKASGAYGNCYEPDLVCCQKVKYADEKQLKTSKEYLEMLEAGVEVNDYLLSALMRDGVPKNNKLFEALKECHTTNVLCGHDHLNNLYCTYQGINLMYALKTGMGSGYRVGRNGGTVLTVHDTTLTMEHYYL